MKIKTTELLEHMFARAEEIMLSEGWKEHEVSAFLSDPVIRLFYGSCAEELEGVYEEIYHVERRLINKTVEYLLPEEFQVPTPAHAIFKAQPIKKLDEGRVWPECQFTVRKDQRNKEFTFAPAGSFSVFHADVEYLVFRDKFYQNKDGNRIQIIGGDSANAFQDNILWLGIRDLNKSLPRDKMSFFFALPQSPNEQISFLNALRYSRCFSAEGELLNMSSGIGSYEPEVWSRMLKQPDQIVYRMLQATCNWYQKHFITLHDLTPKPPNAPLFPTEFKNRFPGNELEKITDDIFWVKFNFSNLLSERWVHLMFCSINCFPALNLRLEQKLFDVEESNINIYPISSDDFIMAINSIGGRIKGRDEELNYSLVDPELRNSANKEGEALFRRGSLGRITSGKLKVMLNHLLNVLKEEVILLTKEGTKEDIDKLNKLNRSAIEFEKCIEIEQEKKGKYSGSVMLRAFKDQSKVYIRFWTSVAEEANTLKPIAGEDGQKQCEISFAPDISTDSLRLITSSIGGKKQPTDEDYIDTLRKLLLTRGRIVTAEDIKAFCYEYFHPNQIKVEIQKKTQQSQRPGQGIERVIKISVKMASNSFTDEELAFFKEELLLRLEQHSANVMPFIIEIS
ncbi:MAG: hypothetical protein ACOYN4_01720 [Bacteroidales bacterium]